MNKFLNKYLPLSLSVVLIVASSFFWYQNAKADSIAFDVATDGGCSTGGSTSFSYSHTTSGTNRILFVEITLTSGTDNISTVTYAGVSMTQIAKIHSAINWEMYMYYLATPAIGANNVAMTSTNPETFCVTSESYTGASQTGIPDASITNTGNLGGAGDFTTTLTTVANNSWAILSASNDNATISASTGTTFRVARSSAGQFVGDSNGPLSSGYNSMSVHLNANADVQTIMASFAPAVTAGAINVAGKASLPSANTSILGKVSIPGN